LLRSAAALSTAATSTFSNASAARGEPICTPSSRASRTTARTPPNAAGSVASSSSASSTSSRRASASSTGPRSSGGRVVPATARAASVSWWSARSWS
jgi:hypothetical protein